MKKNGVKELRNEIIEKFSDVLLNLEEIEDITAIHKNVKKLNSMQLENYISLSKESISSIKQNINELSSIIKATKLYVKDIDALVKKIG